MIYLILIIVQLLQPAPLYVVSPDFEHGGSIPAHCTCDGLNAHPTLIVHGIPEAVKSLALIVEDLSDEPAWLVWNIPPTETLDKIALDGGQRGVSTSAYRGPCPESEVVQTYTFKVYALDTLLQLRGNVGRIELEEAMRSHILATGELQGNYSRTVVRGNNGK